MKEAKGIGATIRRLRLDRGWTQAKLAERAGLTVSEGRDGCAQAQSVSFHETGRTQPSIASLEAYARAFGCTVAELRVGTAGGARRSIPLDELARHADECEEQGRYEAASVLRRLVLTAKNGDDR